jgi:hypothetical protein
MVGDTCMHYCEVLSDTNEDYERQSGDVRILYQFRLLEGAQIVRASC